MSLAANPVPWNRVAGLGTSVGRGNYVLCDPQKEGYSGWVRCWRFHGKLAYVLAVNSCLMGLGPTTSLNHSLNHSLALTHSALRIYDFKEVGADKKSCLSVQFVLGRVESTCENDTSTWIMEDHSIYNARTQSSLSCSSYGLCTIQYASRALL